jgi:hypothetical protein
MGYGSDVSLYSGAINLLCSCIISPFLINQVVDSRISQSEVREEGGPYRAANFILAILLSTRPS